MTGRHGVLIDMCGRWSVIDTSDDPLEDVLGAVLQRSVFISDTNEHFEFIYDDSGKYRGQTNKDVEQILKRGWYGPCVVMMYKTGDILEGWDGESDLKDFLMPRFVFENDMRREQEQYTQLLDLIGPDSVIHMD